MIALAGCRNDMYDQPRYETLEPSRFFPDGASARPLVEGTVPVSSPSWRTPPADPQLADTGKKDGLLAATAPFPVDRAVLERGRERYTIFCAPCHGDTGDGRGIIVRRGFTAPPALYSDELRNRPLGHFFEVITHGHGVMYSYAARIPPPDRWAIAAYIRAIQLSQHAEVAGLSEQDRRGIEEGKHEPDLR